MHVSEETIYLQSWPLLVDYVVDSVDTMAKTWKLFCVFQYVEVFCNVKSHGGDYGDDSGGYVSVLLPAISHCESNADDVITDVLLLNFDHHHSISTSTVPLNDLLYSDIHAHGRGADDVDDNAQLSFSPNSDGFNSLSS